MKERYLSKTPNVTFVHLSKCNIKLPGIFGNSKKRFFVNRSTGHTLQNYNFILRVWFVCLFYLPLSPLSPLYVCFCLLCSVWFCICLSLRCQYCTNIPRCFCNLSLGFCDLVLYLPLSFLSILYRCICVLCLCLVFCVLCLCSEFCLLCGSKYASLFLVNIVFLCFCALCSVFCGLSSVLVLPPPLAVSC